MNAAIKKWVARIGISLLVLIALVEVYVYVRIYWLASCVIPTSSMAPTIIPGDYVLVSLQIPGRRMVTKEEGNNSYRIERIEGKRKVRRGDVVIFNYPYWEQEERMEFIPLRLFCKRCVAVAGETYSWPGREEWESVRVPGKGEQIVLDSLNFKDYRRCIAYETGVMPTMQGGHIYHADSLMQSYCFTRDYYFMQGDNAQNSHDSRAWGVVPEDFILGVALCTWFSKDPETGNIRWERIGKDLLFGE